MTTKNQIQGLDDEQEIVEDVDDNDAQIKFYWDIDENVFADFQEKKECESNEVEVDNYKFVLRLNTSDDVTELILELIASPEIVGAAKMHCSIRCDKISYHKQQYNIIMRDKEKSKFQSSAFKLEHETISELKNVFDLTQLLNNKENITCLQIECNIDILIQYDLFGFKFSEVDKPLSIKPTSLNNMVVYGYLNEIHHFDINRITSIPLSIYELIYKFYLMFINIKHCYSGDFIWKFDNKYDMKLFLNCNKGDVITSRKFEVSGCVFYVELTPNGWGRWVKEGECAVWFACDQLPKHVKQIFLEIGVICNGIDYNYKRKDSLSTPEFNSKEIAQASYSLQLTHQTKMKLSKFHELQQFEFEISLKIINMTYLDGKKIELNDEHSQQNDNNNNNIAQIKDDWNILDELSNKLESDVLEQQLESIKSIISYTENNSNYGNDGDKQYTANLVKSLKEHEQYIQSKLNNII